MRVPDAAGPAHRGDGGGPQKPYRHGNATNSNTVGVRSAQPARSSLYDGRRLLGTLLEHGRVHIEAIDPQGRAVGTFTSVQAATSALVMRAKAAMP